MNCESTQNARSHIRYFGGMLCIIILTAGCQFGPKEKPIKWPWKKDEAKALPERILPVWTDSVLHQPNQPGVRGFGGRIYFYAKEDTDPIEVDGSLAVYVFDADDMEANSQRPLRKYVFTADQFNEHMSKTSIGPSYSIWLPWGEVGGPPRRLSLIARFEGREGGTTISDPTIKLLPGVPKKEQKEDDDELATEGSNSPFRLSSHLNQRGSKKKRTKRPSQRRRIPRRRNVLTSRQLTCRPVFKGTCAARRQLRLNLKTPTRKLQMRTQRY